MTTTDTPGVSLDDVLSLIRRGHLDAHLDDLVAAVEREVFMRYKARPTPAFRRGDLVVANGFARKNFQGTWGEVTDVPTGNGTRYAIRILTPAGRFARGAIVRVPPSIISPMPEADRELAQSLAERP